MAEALPANAEAARQATLSRELQRLETEITAYEDLRGGTATSEDIQAQGELGLLPILARISKQLSQKELATRLGMKEQQIQRYERDRYASISLDRYQKVLEALGVELQPKLVDRAAPMESEELQIDLTPDLLRELRKRNWVDLHRTMPPTEMRRALNVYVLRYAALASTKSLHRKTRSSKPTTSALDLWTARVLEVAGETAGRMRGKFNIADTTWLSQLVGLSAFPDGPIRALNMLRDHGIITVIEPHLPKTLLDGAALMIDDGVPIVALTLRHDRLDNFWFTLLHELGHVFLHFNTGLQAGFIDDDLGNQITSDTEREADDFARNKLIADHIWKTSVVRFTTDPDSVVRFARKLGVHPALVAGRIRNERDFSLFSELVGSGQVRKLFASYSP